MWIHQSWTCLPVCFFCKLGSEVAKEGTTTNSRWWASSCSLFSKVADVVGGWGCGSGCGCCCCCCCWWWWWWWWWWRRRRRRRRRGRCRWRWRWRWRLVVLQLAANSLLFGVFCHRKTCGEFFERNISSWRGWGRYLQHLEGPPGGSVQHEIVFTGVQHYKCFVSQYLVESLSIAWDAQHIVWCHILESFSITCLFHLGYYCISFFTSQVGVIPHHLHPCPPNLVILVGSHGIVHRFNPIPGAGFRGGSEREDRAKHVQVPHVPWVQEKILGPDDWKFELNVASLSLNLSHIIPIHMCVQTHRLCYMYICCCPHIRRIRCWFFPWCVCPAAGASLEWWTLWFPMSHQLDSLL